MIRVSLWRFFATPKPLSLLKPRVLNAFCSLPQAFKFSGNALPPPTEDSDDELMLVGSSDPSDEEAEIVPYDKDAIVAAVANMGAGGSASQIRPFDPPRLQKWIMSVHADPETKNIKLKYRLNRLKFKIKDIDLRE